MSRLKIFKVHRPKKPKLTLDEFSFFLSGLIDADGHINKLGNLVIAFHQREISIAHYIKARIGYGTVAQVKDKKAITYTCSHPKGKRLIANLILGKLINLCRIKQFNTRFVPKTIQTLCKPNCVRLDNHWLAGFIQGDGSLQIKVLSRPNRPIEEIRLVVQIDLKQVDILKQIQALIGGFVGYRNKQNTYYYSSVSFGRAAQFIHYLDNYQLMGPSLTLYWMWRESYLIVQHRGHLTIEGVKQIVVIKTRMSKIRGNE